MAKKKNDTKKKKGPKGKKARAKAKLERHWGEHVVEDTKKFRKGKSRILSSNDIKKEKKVDDDEENDSTSIVIESDPSDDEEEEEDAFSNLLQSIEEKKKLRRHLQINDQDDDDSSTTTSESVDTDDDDELSNKETEKESTMNNDNNNNNIETKEKDDDDPFTRHFHNRNPLPEDDQKIQEVLKEIQTLTKVPSSSFEIQLSKNLKTRDAEKFFEYNRKILKENWNKLRNTKRRKQQQLLTKFQSTLYPSLVSYADMLLSDNNHRNELHSIIALHIMNHVLTSRGRIQRNNKKKDDDDDARRDQGYTRPTVLILLPTRGTCYTFLHSMMSLLLGEDTTAQVENMDRFQTEYGPVENMSDNDDDDRRRKAILESKGEEWNSLFGDDVNSDDDFKLGVSFLPKSLSGKNNQGLQKKKSSSSSSIKLYSSFYKSDIIFASPLALKMNSVEEEDEENDIDYLSSIEICFLAYSEVLLLQNWDHVRDVLDLCLNKQPLNNNATDFSRVREYLLAGQAKHWRQLIVSTKFTDPNIVSTFKRHAVSVEGMMKVSQRVLTVDDAALSEVLVPTLKQVFQRIPCTSFSTQGEDRLVYFEKHLLPQIQRTTTHTMIFVPSYFEFISLRNLLLQKELIFVSVTEYARVSEVSRGRARFLQGRKPLLLYTGRAHYYNRHVIKGVQHLIMYGLPEHPEFYSEIVNMIGNNDNDTAMNSCLTLFSPYEAHALERICGKSNCQRMLQKGKDKKSTFIFIS